MRRKTVYRVKKPKKVSILVFNSCSSLLTSPYPRWLSLDFLLEIFEWAKTLDQSLSKIFGPIFHLQFKKILIICMEIEIPRDSLWFSSKVYIFK